MVTVLMTVDPVAKAATVTTSVQALTAFPNPVGIGQPVRVTVVIQPSPPPGDFYHNLQFSIDSPDGVRQYIGAITSDASGGTSYTYTPTIAGKYILSFSFPGETLGADWYTPCEDSISFFVTNGQAALTWHIETVDTGENQGEKVGKYTSIALDSNGNPHISYSDSSDVMFAALEYAKWTGTEWIKETVDQGDTGRYTSIALDSNDNPHMSYYDVGNTRLKYAKWTGTEWIKEFVEPVGPTVTGMFSSIALDSNDNPHISYYDNFRYSLKYAKWTGTEWSIEFVDLTPEWGETRLSGWDTSIALDSDGNPHISYYNLLAPSWGRLKYAKWTGTEWIKEVVDEAGGYGSDTSVGQYTSIALDSDDNPHISYYDKSNSDLKYAKWTGTEWIKETVDQGEVGRYTSIALDSNCDNPHISYYDEGNTQLKYAMWTGAGWSIEAVDTGPDAVGMMSSIALDSDGNPHISYYDETNLDLKYARAGPPSPSDCVIATATYGSEVEPEVQFLRDFRDTKVLSTFSGSNFMTAFNAFYYSWSPPVANVIRGNEALRSLTRGFLTPLVGTLFVSWQVYELFQFSSELAIIIAGFVAGSLIGGIYLGIPLAIGSLLSSRLSDKLKSRKVVVILLLLVVCGFALISSGFFLSSATFSMLGSALLILSSMALSAAFTARVVLRLGKDVVFSLQSLAGKTRASRN
jgi:hypothetical protein